jgi:hypothetical protein
MIHIKIHLQEVDKMAAATHKPRHVRGRSLNLSGRYSNFDKLMISGGRNW